MLNEKFLNENDLVLLSVKDHICTLTLNRPRHYNALSMPMIESISTALDKINEDKEIHVVILAGNGPGFCSGHDLKEICENKNQAYTEALFSKCSQMMLKILKLNQPVIAKVHSIATAAGCQLAASCDLVAASEKAQFATPGVNIGLFCSTPMVALTRSVSRKHAMEMLLTGDMFSAEHAFNIGLVNKVVKEHELDSTVEELALKIASKSPLTVSIGKRAFYKQIELGISDAYEYANAVMCQNMLKNDADEGIRAFIEKRQPKWTGS
ncbi:Enoyl-CoA hydratase/isomerase [Desulfonema limicola]|uniref:Enoyl-CoA hydratase domain-containing protein 3, mitochondrial n=1 Tax=Desulfonema limicola TaxID=45656 RepID=A0A975GGZ2_9BACT|nr:enoyl-CoA hydratase [Desulfonema limicola]QTA80713.1 Enoyl-CoA hydratase/isomerase [Desulfonema limicola]